ARLPRVDPGDPDFSTILAIDPGREQISFATHDRTGMVTIPWDSLPSEAERMTQREWAAIAKVIRDHAGNYALGKVSVGNLPSAPSARLARQVSETALPATNASATT